MGVPPCTPVPLVEIHGDVLPCTILISVEMSVHMYLRASVHVLLRASLLVLPCVYFSVHVLPQASVHAPPQEYVLAVSVPCVYMLFYPIYSCEVTLAVALRYIFSTSGFLSGIPFIIARNRRKVSPCSGLVKESANIFPSSIISVTSPCSRYDA